MASELLTLERDGNVSTVWLNRPDAFNALSIPLMQEIETAALGFREDEDTRVVVFRGRGKHFSAGADLKAGQGPRKNLVMRRRDHGLGARMIRAVIEIPQVTIAGVHGAALGGAACLATACDFRIGTDDCFAGYPEVNLGMNLMWHSLPLCVRLIGPARAKRMIMLGDNEPAETLLEWGFLDSKVPASELDAAIADLADRYAGQPPVAVQMIKQSINAVSSALDDAIMHMDADQNLLTAHTNDYREGLKACLEKREPEFKGD